MSIYSASQEGFLEVRHLRSPVLEVVLQKHLLVVPSFQ